MKIKRSISEQRFKNLLKKVGFNEADIKEPDLEHNTVGTADFLLDGIVFEVKEIALKKDEELEVEKLRQNLKNGKVESFWVPDKTIQFKADIKNARKKFKEYPNYATVLVEDLTSWWWHEPDIEKMMFGVEALNINAETGDILNVSWKDREIRLDQNRDIGSYIFITASNILIYHNLMADNLRMMPIEYMKKFMNVTPYQFMFVNLPNSPALIRRIV